MKKNKFKKIFLTCMAIAAPVALVSIVAASCNNDDLKKDNSKDSNVVDKNTKEKHEKHDSSSENKEHEEHDHSSHDHSKEDNDKNEKNEEKDKNTDSSKPTIKPKENNEEDVSKINLTSSEVDKLPLSDNGVVNIEKVATTSDSIHFSVRFTNQVNPKTQIKVVISDKKGNETARSFETKNNRKTKYIDLAVKGLEPLTEYSIKRIVLEDKKSSLNNETTFETSAKPPRLAVAEGNFINGYVTNEAFKFDSIASTNSTSISYSHSLDMRFENFEKIVGLPLRVSLKLVGAADKHNQDLGDAGDALSNVFFVDSEGKAKVFFGHRVVDWKRKYTISKIEIDFEYLKNQQNVETISISKTFTTPIEITSDSGQKYHIEKIDFNQSKRYTEEGEFLLTFSEVVPASERNKIKLVFNKMSEDYVDEGGFSLKTNKGEQKFLNITGYELTYDAPNPLLKISYGNNEYVLSKENEFVIPQWSAPSEEEIENKKEELKNIEFGFQSTVELNVGFHPSHRFLPENATASIGPEEKVTEDNISLNEVVYKQYVPMKFVSKDSVEGQTNDSGYWFLMSILIDGDPIANLESNLFMTAELENMNEDSEKFGEIKESEMGPISSNGSAKIWYVTGKPSEIKYYDLNFHIKTIKVWRKEPNQERVLIKTFEPEKLGLNPLRIGRSHSA